MRLSFLAWLAAALLLAARAQDEDSEAPPPIVITSPDQATTFAFSSVKEHTLLWDAKNRMFLARIVFEEEYREDSEPSEDTYEFRLPGVSFDATKGIFYATSAAGEAIPVAKMQRELFLKVIRTLPNAVIRIEHPRGRVSVVLEALKPDDPALRAPPPSTTNSDDGQTIDIRKSFR